MYTASTETDSAPDRLVQDGVRSSPAVPPETERFLTLLARAVRAKKIVEIGSLHGTCTASLAVTAEAIGASVLVVEPVPERAHTREVELGGDFASRVVLRRGAAHEEMTRISGPFDLAVLNLEDVAAVPVLRVALPRVRVGGIIAILGAGEARECAQILSEHPQAITSRVEAGLSIVLGCKLG
jgi:predicted O-methyltransferase YrrM